MLRYTIVRLSLPLCDRQDFRDSEEVEEKLTHPFPELQQERTEADFFAPSQA